MSELWNIRLATTEAGLSSGWLIFSWNLPEPTLPIYSDHSTRQNTQAGGVALRGFESVTMQFERLDASQIRTLKRLVEDALNSSGILFATVNRNWGGLGPSNDWIDVSGVPSISAISPLGNTKAQLFDGATLTINDITVENENPTL